MEKKNIKGKKILRLGNFLTAKKSKTYILLIDSDKLLFLKKYKNMQDVISLGIVDKRIHYLVSEILKYKIKLIYGNNNFFSSYISKNLREDVGSLKRNNKDEEHEMKKIYIKKKQKNVENEIKKKKKEKKKWRKLNKGVKWN